MKLKMIAALGLAALSVALPSAARAQSSAPVLLAMASFAGSHAGTDAAREVEAKKARYRAHALHNGKCKDCADCPDCKDCDEAAKKVAADEERAGICDPAAHAKKAGAGA